MIAPPLAVRVALSLHAATPYVAGAYLAFVTVIGTYIAIMGVRQRRLRRQMADLAAEARERTARTAAPASESHDAPARRDPPHPD